MPNIRYIDNSSWDNALGVKAYKEKTGKVPYITHCGGGAWDKNTLKGRRVEQARRGWNYFNTFQVDGK